MIGRIRRAPTSRLVPAVAGLLLSAAAVAAAAPALTSGASPPAPASADEVLTLASRGSSAGGISGRLEFRNELLPSLDTGEGQPVSPLLAGGSGRFWQRGSERRFELQSDGGDVQVLIGASGVRVLDASAGTESVLPFALPALASGSGGSGLVPAGWSAGAVRSDVVAGRPAYRLDVHPDDRSSLLAGVEVVVDADTGLPLGFGVLAAGTSRPVLSVELHDARIGAVPSDVFRIDSRSSDLVSPGRALGGLAPAGGAEAVVGSGLATVYRWREPAGAGSPFWSSLPEVTVGGSSARVLATPLGTVLRVDRGAGADIYAGLVSPETVRAAAGGA
jgi:hypothetical protein